ncbi:MAG: glutamate synthase large subunit [Nitrospirota bacterium]
MSNTAMSASCGVGFICNVHGTRSHEIVRQGVEAVVNLTHRGAVGADGKTGDGAGVLIQLPKKFFRREGERLLGYAVPDTDTLAVGFFFIYRDDKESGIEAILRSHGLTPLGWREVPVNDSALGASALAAKPRIRQLLIDTAGIEASQREVRLYLARRTIEKACGKDVYVPSLSSRTIVYKGMLIAPYLAQFYPDLVDEDVESAFCLFHQRFSTNTSPDWTLAQPFRVLGHNGEINTLQGNRNYMSVLEHEVQHRLFGDKAELLRPLISYEESDSASLDRIVELMVLSGMSPEHAVSMCIPPAWENRDRNGDERAFFEYQSVLMKPWDGPAAVAFTDGETVGAHMDRNGLRPLRYALTEDGILVLGSEIGMVDLGNRPIREKGRLGPGETLAVNTRTSLIRFTDEIIGELAAKRPYAEWMRTSFVGPKPRTVVKPDPDEEIVRKQIAFGYTMEEIDASLREMAVTGKEPVFSMGDDTPLPSLAAKPQLLFRYFKQKFSQVTNPPIDPIRERMVMSLRMYLGPKGNFLEQAPAYARQLAIDSPILSKDQLREIESQKTFAVKRIPLTYPEAGTNLSQAVKTLQESVLHAAREGAEIIVLYDSGVSGDRLAIPSLLAVSASFKRLLREKMANRASLIVETGEARDEHHMACLIGYGASAVCPSLAFQTINDLCEKSAIKLPYQQAALNYIRALESGLLKSIARMGISTVRSYHGAQLFDSICLSRAVVDEYFAGTPVTLEADGLDEIEDSLRKRHEAGFGPTAPATDYGGNLRYRKEGEYHAWSAPIVAALNRFAKSGDHALYKEFSRLVDGRPLFIRHLLGFRKGSAMPLDAVEPEEAILRRFVAGAMSVGALSPEAHETIAEACNRLGIRSNSGEGGEDPARYFGPKNSAVKQVASGRFGVTPAYLASAADLEIKIAQGAKPGEGGHLPAVKVDSYIAMLRHCAPNMLLISPPPHHDIYSIEDLAQLIHDLKQANPKAHVCVKLVAETGVGTIAAGVAKAYADIVQISGCEGGTGAATISSIKNAGNYWEIGLAETQKILIDNGLRDRIRVRADGGMRTGRDVIIAALLGADEFGFGTAVMIAAGCVMVRQCHANTCPTGIATQDPKLRARFRGTVEGVTAYFRAVAREVREIMAEMGVTGLTGIIGRSDLLIAARPEGHRASNRIKIERFADTYVPGQPRQCARERNDNPAPSMNDVLVAELLPFIEKAERVEREYTIRNIHRSVPVKLNYYIARAYRDQGLPPDTIQLTFRGTAGQSFGAFNHRGLSLTLIGDANDYAGKGMFGGRIAVIPSDIAEPRRQVIAGNTVLYGATGGAFYAAGRAGERFAVRNSGALAVIEGTGHHLCEYMTRGTVVVLGEVGYNVGAGMTGGVLYIPDDNGSLLRKINTSSVVMHDLVDDDVRTLRTMIENHRTYTRSVRAAELLADVDEIPGRFKKILPI